MISNTKKRKKKGRFVLTSISQRHGSYDFFFLCKTDFYFYPFLMTLILGMLIFSNTHLRPFSTTLILACVDCQQHSLTYAYLQQHFSCFCPFQQHRLLFIPLFNNSTNSHSHTCCRISRLKDGVMYFTNEVQTCI